MESLEKPEPKPVSKVISKEKIKISKPKAPKLLTAADFMKMATKGEMPPEFNDSDEEEDTVEPEID